MVDLGVDLERLRADFRSVRGWCVGCGEWTEAEADEIGAGIKAALDTGAFGELAFWAEWMAEYAALARADRDRLAQLEERALAEARRERGLL